MIPFELHIHMCFHVTHTWLLLLQNDLWIFIMNLHVKLYLWCMIPIIIYIFDITHNIQLSCDYNCVNVITYLHHVSKLHMLNIKWWTLIFHINKILNNIAIILIGGCIKHQILLISYAISWCDMLHDVMVIVVG
jgi:hypothetical protein